MKTKRFNVGDIVFFQNPSSQDTWFIGLYWGNNGQFDLIRFSAPITNLDISDTIIEERDLIIFPELDMERINSYVTKLIGSKKITFPYNDIQERVSDKTGEKIYYLSKFIIPEKIKTIEDPEWLDELLWCPSQCYCRFIDELEKEIYCIYLRWRHLDPWTAKLVPCKPDGLLNYGEDWEIINTKEDYKKDNYENLKKEVLNIIKEKFKKITWISIDNDLEL